MTVLSSDFGTDMTSPRIYQASTELVIVYQGLLNKAALSLMK